MIEVKGLSYGKILDSISFSMDAGETLGVIGHNGAGKTTLFHVLLGLKFKTSGNFTLADKKLGFVPERPYLVMDETFQSFLKLHLNLISFPPVGQNTEMWRVATLVGLEQNLPRTFSTFSKGMLQKAMLAQSLLGDPKLIFLDEPMSGLDPESREDFKKQLLELKRRGVTLVLSTHILEDLPALADSVLVLDHGKQKFFGPISEWGRT